MSQSFSVTKVRLAFECPRLFYLYEHFGGRTLFLPSGGVGGVGQAFHKLSGQCIGQIKQQPEFQQLLQPEANQIQVAAVAAKLQESLYRLVFFPYLQATIQAKPNKAEMLHQLWQGLIGLIQHWAKLLVSNRRYCSAQEVIRNTFLAQELNIQHRFTLPNGSQQLVRGRCDSLIYDFEHHRLCVVEYKTYQSPDPSAQLAQVALYGYMLRARIGVPINSAVYSVLPDWQELTFTWDELENTVHQLIPYKLQHMRQWVVWQPGKADPPPSTAQPHLCDICPQRTKCQTLFTQVSGAQLGNHDQISKAPKSPSPKHQNPTKIIKQPKAPVDVLIAQAEEPASSDNLQSSSSEPKVTLPTSEILDPEQIACQLVATLQSFGIEVTHVGSVLAPAFIRVKLKPSLGVKVNAILKSSNDLRVQLGLMAAPLIAPQAGYVSVDLPRGDRQSAYFDQYLKPQRLPIETATRIAIGVDLDGKLIEADLSDPNTCHFLVGGTTGSGKSEFLRSLLLSLLIRQSPDQLRIALVDPKRVTFPEFETMEWLLGSIVKDSESAVELMEQLVGEMESRYQRFEQTRCNDLGAYNQRMHQQGGKRLPRIVCIFDEYADFMAEKEIAKALELSIKRLGAMARAAGIHLIIATQRPEARIVTPVIRSNLPGRVALRTASEADSMIILGSKQGEAAYLLGKGDLLYLAGAQLLRLQSLFVPQIQLPNHPNADFFSE